MSTVRNRRSGVIVLATLVALMMAALAPAFTARAASKVLRYQTGEPSTLDPQASSFTDSVAEEAALFRGLLRYDDKGIPSPSIAKEVPTVENGGVSKDGKTYTYHLGDFKWSDGKGVVTAQDFVYSYERLIDPKLAAPYGTFFNDIIKNATEISNGKAKPTELGIKAVDDKTVQFTLVKAVSYFNAMTSLWVGYAVRKDNVERAGLPSPDAWTDPANGEVVGAGPFKLTKWDHNKLMVFSKNTNFSGDPAKLDEVDWPLIDDAAVAYAGYQSDQIDISAFPTAELPTIQADPVLSKELLKYNSACSFYLGLDNTRPPFNNKKVRMAFAYALDRDLYIKVVTQNLGIKQLSFLPDSIPGNEPDLGKDFDFNPAKAKQMLADAGYPDGKGFPDVNYNYVAGANGQRRADWYQAQFHKILNIDIKLNPMDNAVYTGALSDIKTKLSGMYTLGWCADYLHPSDWLGLVFGTGQGNNSPGFSDPAFDKLSKDADSDLNPVSSIEKYKKAQELLVSDVPVVFTHNVVSLALVKPRVQNLIPLALDGNYPGSFFWEKIDLK